MSKRTRFVDGQPVKGDTGFSMFPDPERAVPVLLGALVDAELRIPGLSEQVDDLQKLERMLGQAGLHFLAEGKPQELQDIALDAHMETRRRHRLEADELTHQRALVTVVSAGVRKPTLAAAFQRELTDFLHGAEGDPDYAESNRWSVLAALGEKYGEEIS